MFKYVSISLLGLLSSFPAMSVDVATQIVNGDEMTTTQFNDDYASFISLFYDRIDYDRVYGSTPYCGATILDSTHILTAAHCLYAADGELDTEFMLFTSVARAEKKSDFPNDVDERIMVADYFIHEDYENSSTNLWPNDIAILRLESPLTVDAGDVVTPIADDTTYRSLGTGESYYAVGHGDIESGVSSDDQLQHVDVIYTDNATCSATFTGGVTANQICFDGEDLGDLKKGTCQGDSGGPIYWSDSGEMKQVGIVSFGPGTCADDAPDVVVVTTEISNYAGWITSVMAGDKEPTYSADDATRTEYLSILKLTGDDSSDSTTEDLSSVADVTSSSSSGGGGGSVPLWSLCMLFIAGIIRKNR